jgi:hypothetical protein
MEKHIKWETRKTRATTVLPAPHLASTFTRDMFLWHVAVDFYQTTRHHGPEDELFTVTTVRTSNSTHSSFTFSPWQTFNAESDHYETPRRWIHSTHRLAIYVHTICIINKQFRCSLRETWIKKDYYRYLHLKELALLLKSWDHMLFRQHWLHYLDKRNSKVQRHC